MLHSTPLHFRYSEQRKFVFPALTCNGGETLLVCGPSGCGKTTLLHLLAGFLKPESGNITLGNTDYTRLSAAQTDHFRGQHIGLILQKSHFIAALTVLDNLLLAHWFGGEKVDKKAAVRLAEELSIGHTLHHLPSRLSIGEQQRASIARALLITPKLILADEPTSALDDRNCEVVVKLLQEKAQEQEAALLIVTHDNRLKDIIPHQVNLTAP